MAGLDVKSKVLFVLNWGCSGIPVLRYTVVLKLTVAYLWYWKKMLEGESQLCVHIYFPPPLPVRLQVPERQWNTIQEVQFELITDQIEDTNTDIIFIVQPLSLNRPHLLLNFSQRCLVHPWMSFNNIQTPVENSSCRSNGDCSCRKTESNRKCHYKVVHTS